MDILLKKASDTLVTLGFKPVVGNPEFLDSPGTDWAGPVVQVFIYKNLCGTCSVDVDGGYKATLIRDAHTPCMEVDMEAFLYHLDKYHPGWRG
jgi:hypothetical protein